MNMPTLTTTKTYLSRMSTVPVWTCLDDMLTVHTSLAEHLPLRHD